MKAFGCMHRLAVVWDLGEGGGAYAMIVNEGIHLGRSVNAALFLIHFIFLRGGGGGGNNTFMTYGGGARRES